MENSHVSEEEKMADEGEEKKNDEEKDMELDLMAEAELLRLTRQYRCVVHAVLSVCFYYCGRCS